MNLSSFLSNSANFNSIILLNVQVSSNIYSVARLPVICLRSGQECTTDAKQRYHSWT